MSEQSIYEQIGGADALEAVVAGFYEKVLADPLLVPFFRGVQMSRQHERQVTFFTMALGGPAIYRGKDMKTTHRGMGIKDAHFDAVAGHLVATLHEAEVPPALIDRIVATIAPLRAQIVESSVEPAEPAAQPALRVDADAA
jgi:hemoglobin